jgi:hypothetical protein
MSKSGWVYTCNEGKFAVKLLRKENLGFVSVIELLEPIPFRIKSKLLTLNVGTILRVGSWQVKKTQLMVKEKEE